MKRFGLRFSWVAVLVLAGCSSGDDDAASNTGAGSGGVGGIVPGSGNGGAQASGAGGVSTSGAGGTTVTAGVGGNTSGAGGTVAGGGNGGSGEAGSTSGGTGGSTAPAAGASVLQYHNHANRDGVYIDAAFTRAAAAGLHMAYSVPISGPTYAQPLFFENGVDGKDLVIVATEENQVSAFDAENGDVVWQKSLAAPAQSTSCALSNIIPLGVTGTPVIDAASKTLYLSAASSDGGFQHKIFALSLDTGETVSGWPINAGGSSNGTTFDPGIQNQRGALVILDGKVFVPYGGHFGDCGDYHGWVVGVPLDNPAAPIGWATRARAGGIWAPGGLASDGTSLFAATGNTMSPSATPPFGFAAPSMWGDGEAIVRLSNSLGYSGMDNEYVGAMNWSALDDADLDIGGSGPVLFSVAGATPEKLVLALGKDGTAYLADATAMGGMGKWVATKKVSNQQLIQAAVAYTTPTGAFFAFKGTGSGCPSGSGQITAVKVEPGAPPTMNVSWCAGSSGEGSPMVTTTDGTAETIVWYLAGSSLVGFNGETGAEVFGGESAGAVNKFQTPIAAKGKIFVAASNELVAFTL